MAGVLARGMLLSPGSPALKFMEVKVMIDEENGAQ